MKNKIYTFFTYFPALFFCLPILLPLYTDNKQTSKSYPYSIIEKIKSIAPLKIDPKLAEFFSKNSKIHPLVSILLSDPLYSIEWFGKTNELISDKKGKLSFPHQIISNFSTSIKRIDIIEDPVSRFFSSGGDELTIIKEFANCLSNALTKFKIYIADLNLHIKNPDNLKALSKFDLLKIPYEKIEKFVEGTNTSQFFAILCLEKFLDLRKSKNLQGVNLQGANLHSFSVGEISVEIYGDSDDIVVVPNYPAIILNKGGKDTYLFTFQYALTPSLTFIIDIEGNDTYTFPAPRSFYLSLIYDESGNDIYSCNIACLGGGFFGAELLFDGDGDDRYTSSGLSQGAGIAGTGVLIDMNGNDIYEATAYSQGFGSLGGGILIDFSGDEKYILRKGDDFPSYQDKKHNLSMGQGCGSGIRADYIEGADSFPGGVGILIDFSGDDSYSSEVFSQGCGYWYGVGVLWDSGGNDRYDGYWYCQGSSAHFGVGLLVDNSGNDSYICDFQGMGHGHDLGAGILFDVPAEDVEDSDNFTCKIRCFGMAHANGVSFFINVGGSDTYSAQQHAYGDALTNIYGGKTIRDVIPTSGFFADIGAGDDNFYLGGERKNPDDIKQKVINDLLRGIFIKKDIVK